MKDNEIYRARTTKEAPPTRMDTGGIPFIKLWGSNGQPHWSPDGSKIAFVSARENHSLIGLYDVKTRKVTYVSPSVDCDGSPTWSPDGKQIAFMRRPGTPFGLQTQQGGGGIGNPGGAGAGRGGASNGLASGCAGFGGRGGGGGGGGGRGGRGGGGGAPADAAPGLYTSTFNDGSTLAMYAYDVATGAVREFWHNEAGDREFTSINGIRWADQSVVFQVTVPNDEWERYFSINVAGTNAAPVELTTTNGLIEDAVSVSYSPDGKTFYYCTNANDIERRHIWAVPTSGGTPPRQVSTGDGVERDPTPLASGKKLAVLYFNAAQPASVALVSTEGSAPKVIFPTLPKSFPAAEHVTPQIIITHAADGLEIHNQLFLPKDLKPGEKRPAIVFVHGGPVRQMLPGVPLHAVLSLGVRLQPVARGRRVHRDVDQLPERSWLWPLFQPGAGNRSARKLRVSGRRGGREVSPVAAGRGRGTRRNLGALVRRAPHVAGACAQLRHVHRGRRSRGRSPVRPVARRQRALVPVVGDLGH